MARDFALRLKYELPGALAIIGDELLVRVVTEVFDKELEPSLATLLAARDERDTALKALDGISIPTTAASRLVIACQEQARCIKATTQALMERDQLRADLATVTEKLCRLDEPEKQIKCWQDNAKALQEGYNKLDKELGAIKTEKLKLQSELSDAVHRAGPEWDAINEALAAAKAKVPEL